MPPPLINQISQKGSFQFVVTINRKKDLKDFFLKKLTCIRVG